jgi:hypothetical protein
MKQINPIRQKLQQFDKHHYELPVRMILKSKLTLFERIAVRHELMT